MEVETGKKPRILVIDDDEMFCDVMLRHIRKMDFDAECELSLSAGMETLSQSDFDIVLLDVMLPDGDGLGALPGICQMHCQPEVIIVTGDGDEKGAELALKNGAWDYIEKPPSLSKLSLSLNRVLQYQKEKKEQKQALVLDRAGVIGEGPGIKDALKQVAKAAFSDANVLITGETGTGKEVFALAIHKNSRRSKKNMVVVDCASLPENLVGSVLFGHVKGAFTGATENHTGLMKQADGGTLFLDEVGELPLTIQKTFLRALQERRFRPVGGNREIESNFRLISATNRNLEDQAKQGQFREDLLYRLRTIHLHLPPLRDRAEDIKELAVHYISRICERHQTDIKGITPEFLEALKTYHWPGNVRELINTLETALIQIQMEKTLFVKHLPLHIRLHSTEVSRKKESTHPDPPDTWFDVSGQFPSLKEFKNKIIENAEIRYLKELTEFSKNSVKEACRLSGISRARLYQLLKKHNLTLTSN
ncbi:sigma-54 dependent transcriptional regulator [bacterium]|nr:sigma-54 dependent transcriptional regulator [bacterium]